MKIQCRINPQNNHLTAFHPPFSGIRSTTTDHENFEGRTCFHQVKMPTKEAKEDDAHDATQDTNEDHHALAKKKKKN